MRYLIEIPTNTLPTFSDLKQKPKDIYEGGWIIFIMFFLFSLYIGKDIITASIKRHNDEFQAEIEEKKAQLREREETIDFMRDQINRLQNERALLKSITGVNSDFLREETNVNEVSSRKNN